MTGSTAYYRHMHRTVPCAMCGARPGEKCRSLRTVRPRLPVFVEYSHGDRKRRFREWRLENRKQYAALRKKLLARYPSS